MSDSLCPLQLRRCESICQLSLTVEISDAFTALQSLVTDETFCCCWDTLPIRIFSGKKIKIALELQRSEGETKH